MAQEPYWHCSTVYTLLAETFKHEAFEAATLKAESLKLRLAQLRLLQLRLLKLNGTIAKGNACASTFLGLAFGLYICKVEQSADTVF